MRSITCAAEIPPITPMSEQPVSANYNRYGPWLRARFGGERVHKVVIDAGFSCPNRDGSKGYGGCAYCNVDSFTPAAPRSIAGVSEQVHHGIQHAREHYGASKFILYFQPNSNTHAPAGILRKFYDEALDAAADGVVGLAVGTRPDCLDPEKIALLESYSKRVVVDLEIGMESMHDSTLSRINRGCTHADFTALMERLRDSPLHLCVHTIFGFPWETRDMMLATADELNRFPQIRFMKLHHLHVVEGSILAAQYRREPFPLFTLPQYADFLCEFLPRLRPDIVIQRLFGLADPDLLIAPKWELGKSAVQRFLDRTLAQRGVIQGSASSVKSVTDNHH
jgi:hypothetical protein